MTKKLTAKVDAIFADSIQAITAAQQTLTASIAQAATVMADALANDGKILICGNGGSAADSLHFSGELINKFRRVRRPLPAISLAADVSAITSIANDENFDAVFAKQVHALAQRGDVLVLLTTSGNSNNIIQAAHAAHENGIRCIALNGGDGGALSAALDELNASDINIIAPANATARVQEIHAIIIHIFCELIDCILFGETE